MSYENPAYMSEGDIAQLLEQASLAYIALRADAMGYDSPWDVTPLANPRMDSANRRFIEDVLRVAQEENGSLTQPRQDSFLPGLPSRMLTGYDPDFIETDYDETPYSDPGFLNIVDMNMPGMKSLKVLQVNRYGKFKVAGCATSNTNPLDAGMAEHEYKSTYVEAHVNYTTCDLDAMAQARANGNCFGFLDVVRYKLNDVVEMAWKESLNDIFSKGIPSLGIQGLHSHYGAPRVKCPLRLSKSSSPDEIISVFCKIVNALAKNSGNRIKRGGLTAIAPCSLVQTMDFMQQGTNGNTSVLDWVSRRAGITEWYTPTEADTAGKDGGPIIHVFRNNENNTKAMITKKLTQDGKAYKQRGKWRVDFHGAVAGVAMRKPYEHLIVEGVTVND